MATQPNKGGRRTTQTQPKPAKSTAQTTKQPTQQPTEPVRRATTPSTREMALLIGRVGLWTLDELGIRVRIIDARSLFGRIDVMVTPVDGNGEKWVDLASIALDELDDKRAEVLVVV